MHRLSCSTWLLALALLPAAGCGGGGGGSSGGGGGIGIAATAIQGTVIASSGIVFKADASAAPREAVIAAGYAGVPGALVAVAGTTTTTTTDAQGFFSVNLPAGSQILIIRKAAADGTVYSFLKAYIVVDGQVLDAGQIEITATGRIQGRVILDDQGDPTGTLVYIPGTSYQARADAQGAYTITEVPAGTYALRFERDGYVTGSLPGVSVVAGTAVTAAAMTLNLLTGTSGSVTLGNGNAYATSRAVGVTLTASPNATVMQLSEDAGFAGAAWAPVSASAQWNFTSDGLKRLYVKFADANGLESASVNDSIIVDTAPPSGGSVVIDGGATVTNLTTVTLTLSAADATTSVAQMKIGNDAALTGSAWEPYAGTRTWTLPPGGGAKTVYVKFMDAAGNETAQAVSDAIDYVVANPTDATPPSVPTGLVAAGRNAEVQLAWNSSTDTGGSGLAGYRVYRGGTLLATTTLPRYADAAVTATTTYNYAVLAYDNAGNESAQSPTLGVTASSGAILLSPSLVTLSARSGDTVPSAAIVNVTYGGGGTLSWLTSAGRPWVQGTPRTGTTAAETDALTVTGIAAQSETWLGPTSMVNPPPAANGITVVWTGTEMWIWGLDGQTIWRYDPATDTWLTPFTTLSPPPMARWRATGIWTGKEMIIWGGLEGGANVNTGYRYNPATNRWTPISAAGAPSGRRGHTAVWTGTEMIVWGGGPVGNDGGRYNPLSDTWGTPPTMTGAPALVGGHVGVWTGREMIVWSGGGWTMLLGGRYDPALNQWVGGITTTNSPVGRNFLMGVWTGTEMIVWGGHDDRSYLNDGARYDPATDTWLGAMAATGAPTPRDGVHAVWTGREVVYWGGHNGSSPQNTGARYRPPISLTPGTYAGTVRVEDASGTQTPGTAVVSFTVTP